MSEQDYFKNALSDFTFEAACGGAIRHLADLGYTVSQIKEQLAFPTALEKVRKTVWEHMLDTGALCLEEPGKQGTSEKFDYIREYDQYGKASQAGGSIGRRPRRACHLARTGLQPRKRRDLHRFFSGKMQGEQSG